MLANTMLRAGISPRDLVGVIPCSFTSLYRFLRHGKGRKLNLFSFGRIQNFLSEGLTANIFPIIPIIPDIARRQKAIYKAHIHWTAFNNFKSFKLTSDEE